MIKGQLLVPVTNCFFHILGTLLEEKSEGCWEIKNWTWSWLAQCLLSGVNLERGFYGLCLSRGDSVYRLGCFRSLVFCKARWTLGFRWQWISFPQCLSRACSCPSCADYSALWFSPDSPLSEWKLDGWEVGAFGSVYESGSIRGELSSSTCREELIWRFYKT